MEALIRGHQPDLLCSIINLTRSKFTKTWSTDRLPDTISVPSGTRSKKSSPRGASARATASPRVFPQKLAHGGWARAVSGLGLARRCDSFQPFQVNVPPLEQTHRLRFLPEL